VGTMVVAGSATKKKNKKTRMGWAKDTKGVKKLAEWRREIVAANQIANESANEGAEGEEKEFKPGLYPTNMAHRQMELDPEHQTKAVDLQRRFYQKPSIPEFLCSFRVDSPVGPSLKEVLPDQYLNARPHYPNESVYRHCTDASGVRVPAWSPLLEDEYLFAKFQQPESPPAAKLEDEAAATTGSSTALVAQGSGGMLVPSTSKAEGKAGAGTGAAAKGAEAKEAGDIREEPAIDIRLAYNLEWAKRRNQVSEARTKLEGLLAAADDPAPEEGRAGEPAEEDPLADAIKELQLAHSVVWDAGLLKHWAEVDRRAKEEPAYAAVLEAMAELAAVPHGEDKQEAHDKLAKSLTTWRSLHSRVGSRVPMRCSQRAARIEDLYPTESESDEAGMTAALEAAAAGSSGAIVKSDSKPAAAASRKDAKGPASEDAEEELDERLLVSPFRALPPRPAPPEEEEEQVSTTASKSSTALVATSGNAQAIVPASVGGPVPASRFDAKEKREADEEDTEEPIELVPYKGELDPLEFMKARLTDRKIHMRQGISCPNTYEVRQLRIGASQGLHTPLPRMHSAKLQNSIDGDREAKIVRANSEEKISREYKAITKEQATRRSSAGPTIVKRVSRFD